MQLAKQRRESKRAWDPGTPEQRSSPPICGGFRMFITPTKPRKETASLQEDVLTFTASELAPWLLQLNQINAALFLHHQRLHDMSYSQMSSKVGWPQASSKPEPALHGLPLCGSESGYYSDVLTPENGVPALVRCSVSPFFVKITRDTNADMLVRGKRPKDSRAIRPGALPAPPMLHPIQPHRQRPESPATPRVQACQPTHICWICHTGSRFLPGPVLSPRLHPKAGIPCGNMDSKASTHRSLSMATTRWVSTPA